MAVQKISPRDQRARRVRKRLKAVGSGRLRLSVARSLKHISAQIIDDKAGVTLASASSHEAVVRDGEKTPKADTAKAVGKLLAERAKEKGVTKVVFDRGSFIFHGRVKALADAAREAGLEF